MVSLDPDPDDDLSDQTDRQTDVRRTVYGSAVRMDRVDSGRVTDGAVRTVTG